MDHLLSRADAVLLSALLMVSRIVLLSVEENDFYSCKKKKRSLYFVVLFIHYEIKNKALYPNLTGTVKV